MMPKGFNLIWKLAIGITAAIMMFTLTFVTPITAQSASGTEQNKAGKQKATIRITKIPKFGSYENLQGVVSGVDPALYQVAVYIKVRNGWWTKPYWTKPVTNIYPNGDWVCDVTTGGIDQYATQYAAYLVPKGYKPPLRSGQGSLPAGIKKAAVAKVVVHRESNK